MDIEVNVYLEDWSNGMRHSKDYVHFMVSNLKERAYPQDYASRYTGYP
jgi:hypothetical protein